MEDAVEVSQSRRRRVPPPSTKRHVAAKLLTSAYRAGALDVARRLAAGVARKVALTPPSIRTAATACCAVAVVALLLCGAAAYFRCRDVSARRGRGRIEAGELQKQAAQLVATNANPSPGATAREQPAAGQEQHQEPPPAPEPVASETPSRSMETEQELLDTNTPGGAIATSDQLPAGNQKKPPHPIETPRRTARPRQPSRRYSAMEWVL